MLIWISREYPEIEEIWITENGVSENVGLNYNKKNANLCDHQRLYYFKSYVNELMQAINTHSIPVKGYTAWSLMDNFEWSKGYTERFGLHWVNFDSPHKERIIKASGYFYMQLVRHNGFPNKYEVDKWERQAMDSCKIYTAMAKTSSDVKIGFNLFLLFISLIMYLII